MRRCTQQQLASLDSLTTQLTASPAAYTQVEGRYLAGVLPLLTPGQYAALVMLRKQPAATPTPR